MWNAVITEAKEWRRDWPLLVFGLIAAYGDGLVIAQALDWLLSGHRLSIWLAM